MNNKYTVVLNTGYGYYTYQVESASLVEARKKAKENYSNSYAAIENGDSDASVVVTIEGWPKTY
ncbi:hypothetical protein [Enterobacter hormaechei]|uniref:hypothetical protein n=1 Tax=Enterobacter hormaechei TaxID=158836 RepID=UPI000735A865|nr:hypothetical protein [Enterobacter hormaechei]CAF2561194.1 hypothetical protein AI2866V1_1719 [Enterobacter cloacae]AWQ43100.1 hypothetical protein BET69_08950 [Enterobacter hormaechei]AWQ57311.1 hypothetical protein CAL61_08950 [Enterobacter hormaechei]KTI69582.1 hypothetical protein ASU99_10630 [Enterobacter hormaechei subsp. steigerwaltii]KVK12781.1 hypothetical protein AWS19_15510 [Enterobacter hormaechei subsp. steigerwaltii]